MRGAVKVANATSGALAFPAQIPVRPKSFAKLLSRYLNSALLSEGRGKSSEMDFFSINEAIIHPSQPSLIKRRRAAAFDGSNQCNPRPFISTSCVDQDHRDPRPPLPPSPSSLPFFKVVTQFHFTYLINGALLFVRRTPPRLYFAERPIEREGFLSAAAAVAATHLLIP